MKFRTSSFEKNLDYKGALAFCRAAELSQTRTKKTLEEHKAVDSLKEQTKRGNVSVNKRHDNSANERCENDDRDAKDSIHKEVPRYKLCGGKHRAGQEKLPSVWEKMLALRKNESFRFSMLY